MAVGNTELVSYNNSPDPELYTNLGNVLDVVVLIGFIIVPLAIPVTADPDAFSTMELAGWLV